MARTAIPATALATINPFYPATPLVGGSQDFAETAVDDPTDRFAPIVEGKTVILARNTDSGAHTITISSVDDDKNRKGDITAYSIAAGKTARFGPFKAAGWASSGNLLVDTSDPLVRLVNLTLP